MNDKAKLKTGLIGTVIAAICCFTPFLVVVLGAVGLSAWLGWLDYVLFPLLFASLGMVAHALHSRFGQPGPPPTGAIVILVVALSALIIWLEFRFALRISITSVAVVAVYAYYLRRQRRPQPDAEGAA